MRLTDRKTAADLKADADSLRELGLEPSILDRRYIKLAEYEDAEELKKTKTHEPVKHGRWMYPFYCSVCGFEPYYSSDLTYNYWPNCGAKMGGDKE